VPRKELTPRRVLYTDASDAFIDHYRRHHPRASYVTLKTLRSVIGQFQRQSHVTYLDEITRYHISRSTTYDRSRARISRLRSFLGWCRGHYGILIPEVPKVPYHPTLVDRRVAQKSDREKLQNAAIAATRCILPHQRFTYLCGYLYGMPLGEIIEKSFMDFTALSLPTDMYALLSELRNQNTVGEVVMEPWLGVSYFTALKAWGQWMGRKGLFFRDVIYAGNRAKLMAGVRLSKGFASHTSLLASLAEMTGENLDQVERPEGWQ